MLDLYSGRMNRVALSADYGVLAPYSGYFPVWNKIMSTAYDFGPVVFPSPSGWLDNDLEPSQRSISGRHPSTADAGSAHARIRYKSLVQFSTNVAQFLNFEFKGLSRTIEGEHEVSHLNLEGCIGESWDEPYPAATAAEEANTKVLPVQFKIKLGSDGREYISTFSDEVDFPAGVEHWSWALDELVANSFIGGPYTVTNVPGSYRSESPAAFRWFTNGSAFVTQLAEYRIYDKAGATYRHDVIHFNILLKPVVLPGAIEYDTWYDLTSRVAVARYTSYLVWTYYLNHANWTQWSPSHQAIFAGLPVDFVNPYPLGSGAKQMAVGYLYRPHFLYPMGYGNVEAFIGYDTTSRRFISTTAKTGLRDFEMHVSQLLSDCYAMSIHSSVDAIDKYTVNMKFNQFEASQDLFGLLTIVDVAKLFLSLRKLDLAKGWSVLLNILDVLADARLVYSFALAPTASDIQTVVEKASAFRERYTHTLFNWVTVNGKHSQLIPNSLNGPFTDTRLTVRSKIRLRLHPDSVLSGVLPLRAAGLLPTMSAMWAVVPFSFVADWIFPTGDLVELAEDALLLQAFDTDYSLHSVLLEWNVDPLTLANLGAAPMSSLCGESELQYRYFDRFILPCMPVVAPSRIITSEIAPGIPSWETAGALFYRLLR